VRGNSPSIVALGLSRGQVTCDVTHREGRRFTVVAGDVEVRVVGTQFTVKSTPSGNSEHVEVSVRRGAVEVKSKRRPGVVARVAAGETWVQLPEQTQARHPHVGAKRHESENDNDDAPLSAHPAESTPAPGAMPPQPGSSVAAPASSTAPPARELFEKAGERRRAGDAAGAARAYEELLRLHPRDGRASLSAFELGRLRMDRLGDPAGAIAALERAVALNLGPGFREDALARLVSVYAAQGNFAACSRARERYLSSYPAGVHATAVSSRCGSR